MGDISLLFLRDSILQAMRQDPLRTGAQVVTDEILRLLGEVLLMDPIRGSKLLGRGELHKLLELTGGMVYLRRTNWRIVPRRYGKEFVKVQLRRE